MPQEDTPGHPAAVVEWLKHQQNIGLNFDFDSQIVQRY